MQTTMLWNLPRLFVLFAVAAGGAYAQQNIAYIDMAKVFDGYYKTIKAENNLKAQEEVYKERVSEISGSIEQIKQRRDALAEESLNIALDNEARRAKKEQAEAADREFNQKQNDLHKFFNDKRNEMRKEYMQFRDGIVKEMLGHVEEFAKANGHELVFDVSGLTQNALPVVIYYPKERDVTEQILSGLNKGHEAEAVRTAPAELPE